MLEHRIIFAAGVLLAVLPLCAVAADSATAPENSPASGGGGASSNAADDVLTMEAFGVEAETVKGSGADLSNQRQRADVSMDFLSAEQLTKFVNTDVGDVIVRIPGLSTTSQGSFAVVRGLAERYNPVMLDGLVLPSADPERQSPQLDIFPTRLVDAIVVSKTYEPRLPAAASGGAIDLRTKPLPEGRFMQIQGGFRFDEGALRNEEFRTYGNDDGTRDYFALGSRSRPSAPASTTSAINAILADTETHPLVSRSADFPVGKKFGVVIEDRFNLNNQGRAWGYALNVGYDSTYGSEAGQKLSLTDFYATEGFRTTLPQTGTSPSAYTSTDYEEYTEEVRLGGMLQLGYAFNERHAISGSVFASQIGIDTVTRNFNQFTVRDSDKSNLALIRGLIAQGDRRTAYLLSDNDQGPLRGSEELQYQERNLTDSKLTGSHAFGADENTRIDWALANIVATQNEPYFRRLNYTETVDPAGVSTYTPGLSATGTISGTSRVYWRDTENETWAGRVDIDHTRDMGALKDVVLRTGWYGESSERTTAEVGAFLNNGASVVPSAPDLGTVNDGLNGATFNLTPFSGSSEATRELDAFYSSVNLPLVKDRRWVKRVDFMLGARVEKFDQVSSGQAVTGGSGTTGFYEASVGGGQRVADILGVDRDYNRDGTIDAADASYTGPLKGEINESTVHPALALTYSPVDRLNIRFASSRTVARPSFREVGPYFTQDQITDETQAGNIGLKTSEVNNYDVRIEYFFPSSKDLVALSVFSKEVKNPVEKIAPRTSFNDDPYVTTWANNPSEARLLGVELEAAKNLGFIADAFSGFTLGGNVTFIEATVKRIPVVEDVAIANVGEERRLFDQPEWIANMYLTYEYAPAGLSATISYYAISDVLQTVQQDAWDRYVASYDRLDLSLSKRFGQHWKLSLSAKNLLDPQHKIVADPEATTEEIVYRRFRDGRSYSATLSYDF
jgi:TonB-dependent receptor